MLFIYVLLVQSTTLMPGKIFTEFYIKPDINVANCTWQFFIMAYMHLFEKWKELSIIII